MAFVAVDEDNEEYIYHTKPVRNKEDWEDGFMAILLPPGSIAKLIGRELAWEDDPVELKD